MKRSGFILLSSVILAVTAQGAVIYTTNFDGTALGDTTPTGWTEPTNSTASTIVGASDQKYQFTVAATSSVGLTNIAGISTTAGQGFTVTTQFSLSNVNPQYATAGILFLSNSTGGSNYRIAYNVAEGNLGLLEFQNTGDAYAVLSNGTAALGPAGALYTLTLSGTYLGTGAVSLTATITNNLNANTTTSTATTDTSPLAGTYFGLRAAAGGTGSPTITATFDNFSVEAIPEPSSVAFLVSGVLLAGIHRRRR